MHSLNFYDSLSSMHSNNFNILTQPARVAEYTDCIHAEGNNYFNDCPGYDIKQPDGEASVMLELWGIWSNPLLPSLPDPLWPGVVAPDRVLSMGQIELFDI